MKKHIYYDISLDELTDLCRKEKDSRLKIRLLAIKLCYEGRKVAAIAHELAVSQKTVYTWINLWNQKGYEGLQPQRAKAGRKGYLSQHEWEEVLQEIEGRGYGIREVVEYVRSTRGATYSYQGIWKILHQYHRHEKST